MTRAVLNSPRSARQVELKTAAGNEPAAYIVIGKDVLELLSSAMYVDPLTIFREYVQNAADAVDEARELGILSADAPGQVAIELDATERRIRIRDNGAGIPIDTAAQRLLSIGGSVKRGTRARGFRGVGRLAGLAYCRQLIFRTRVAGDDNVFQLRWDCVKLKAALREVGQDDDLPGVINRIVGIDILEAGEFPPHFFEVEMIDVVRHHRRDALLNEDLVSQYLSEVAPIPFHEDFRHCEAIEECISPYIRVGDLQIHLNGSSALRRPHRNVWPVSETEFDEAGELELLTFEGRDGGVAAVGWLIHHSYLGALPERAGVKGLRLRAGNVQVGTSTLLEEVFPEPRFNSWTVGEFHVVDPRLVPNARRDHFEQNVLFADLVAQIEPIARRVAKRCRSASIERNRLKSAEASVKAVVEQLRAEAHVAPLQLISKLQACANSIASLLRGLPPSPQAGAVLDTLSDLELELQSMTNLDVRERIGTQLRTALADGSLSERDLLDIVTQSGQTVAKQ